MKISVIVPYWNAEKWVGRCCDSLLSQDGDFEFIMVNDHSTDNSEGVVRIKQGDRFVMLTNKHGKGVSGARNTGIDHATGEWVTFLDADDELLPNAYDTFTAVIKADHRANIHQLNHLRYYAKANNTVLKYANNAGVYCIGKLPQAWFGVWNKLYKREFLDGVRYAEGLQYGEDGLFILECLAKDNYIHHADKDVVAVKHRFDNAQSLSHVKTADDVYKQIVAYGAYWARQTDKLTRIEVAQEIIKLWQRAISIG